jgi:hypothetical protein
MAHIAELDAAPETVVASLNYLADTGEKLVTQVAEPGGRDSRSGGATEAHRVAIHNGRPLADHFEFEREGFRFVDHATRVGNFADEDEIRRVYYPEVEALIKAASGAKRVVVFDHTCALPARSSARPARSATSSAASITTTPNGRGRSGCAT